MKGKLQIVSMALIRVVGIRFQVARGSVVDLPLWLAQDLVQRQIVHVKLPGCYNARFAHFPSIKCHFHGTLASKAESTLSVMEHCYGAQRRGHFGTAKFS